jgi:HEAT repeat protein
MVDYEPPDSSLADKVKRADAESERQHARLRGQPPAALKAVVRDPNEPYAARGNAMLLLLQHRDPELPEIVLGLFDDPDQSLWRLVIRCYCPDDARIRSRLLALLDDENEDNWSEAAVALARRSGHSLLPRFEGWLREGDRPHRNVAVECLKALNSPEANRVLQEYWDRGDGDEKQRLLVAAALLSAGDDRGRTILEAAARGVQGGTSVFAATAIHAVDRREGLNLMMHILDEGDLEARQSMVTQIGSFAQLPHAFTAEGLDEARSWVRSELQKLGV